MTGREEKLCSEIKISETAYIIQIREKKCYFLSHNFETLFSKNVEIVPPKTFESFLNFKLT